MSAARRSVVLVAAGLLASGLLAGCGKKSGVEPPPGEEARFTYPRAYPQPLPGTKPPPAQAPKPEETPSYLSPFPKSSRTTTRSY